MKRKPSTPTSDKDKNRNKRAKKAAVAPPELELEPKVKTYSKLKVNGCEFAVGDDVKLYEWTAKTAYARVNKIYTVKGSSDPMCNITWHYAPKDLYSEEHDFFGEAELLTSDHT
jgi:hypothetical protein